jgi:Ni/Fe-hydrogenase subunit HybB-like protein
MDDEHKRTENDIVLGFGKAAAFVLAAYFVIKVFGVALGDNWSLLGTSYGLWFLLEIIGFVLLPCFLYLVGVRDRNVKLIRWTAVLTVLGIVLNRLNICVIAFNWQLPAGERYFPSWMEIGISIFVVTVGVTAYRFIVTRMPVFFEHPEFTESH